MLRLILSTGRSILLPDCTRAAARHTGPNFKISLDSCRPIHNHVVVDALDTAFSALSDGTRRAMVEHLSLGPVSVHRLTERFALSQQMISKHVAYLVRAQIVVKTRRGRESICELRPEAIRAVSEWAANYRQFWEESFDKLDSVLNEMKKETGDGKRHGK